MYTETHIYPLFFQTTLGPDYYVLRIYTRDINTTACGRNVAGFFRFAVTSAKYLRQGHTPF